MCDLKQLRISANFSFLKHTNVDFRCPFDLENGLFWYKTFYQWILLILPLLLNCKTDEFVSKTQSTVEYISTRLLVNTAFQSSNATIRI